MNRQAVVCLFSACLCFPSLLVLVFCTVCMFRMNQVAPVQTLIRSQLKPVVLRKPLPFLCSFTFVSLCHVSFSLLHQASTKHSQPCLWRKTGNRSTSVSSTNGDSFAIAAFFVRKLRLTWRIFNKGGRLIFFGKKWRRLRQPAPCHVCRSTVKPTIDEPGGHSTFVR